ncbi:sphingomyelin phosphodiesterase 1-like [Vespula pensylvanica]|uniref:sphingomyelin phosphodiesterase 1-like n=1 Tax=Vespula pensylvanica TaxID=30213 RepID=UPI001CBA307B|nr:sphingomyelin phosphodiesterase 1-like [Vespula pensylvanica]
MRFNIILLIFSIFSLVNGFNNDIQDINVTSVMDEITKWVNSGEETEMFKESIQVLTLPNELQLVNWRTFTALNSMGICTICKSILQTFIKFRQQGMSENDIAKNVIKLCVLLNFQTERVCTGIVKLNLPIILHIIDSKSNIHASDICGIVLESKSCPFNVKKYEWTVPIDHISTEKISMKESNDTIQIIQITDIHYDPKYEPYGNSFCNEPTCCRKGQNITNSSNKTAGYWADYNKCDTPWHSVTNALSHIKVTHQNIDYIYFTGDVIDHGVWETSMKGNIEILHKTYSEIYKHFKDIPVYPILGNHESHPMNQFAPRNITDDNLSTDWLYSLVADLWISFGWLPESTRATILQGGFYTLSPRKGFRIIALNSNICYCYNWWLLYQHQDPDGQLQWLVETLTQAQKNKELVHILSHIPPGDHDCQYIWKREYLKIINKFSHIIAAQFNGHTHNDELRIVYKDKNAKNVSHIAWNGGSITTYVNLNPNYKLYTIDNNTLTVKDFENWIYNITVANENPTQQPQWYKSYSFKNEYNLTDLSLDSLNNWFLDMRNNKDTLNRYYKNFFKHADAALQKNCDLKCKEKYINSIIVTVPH